MAFVVLVVFLMVFVWAWAVRRPVPVGGPEPTPNPLPLIYAAIGASDVVGAGADDPARQSWVNVLHEKMPLGTRLVRLGRGGITLREANRVEVPQAVAAQPDIVTMWNCVNDALQGVQLAEYTRDLNAALTRLTGETQAKIVVLNMPDISILTMGYAGPEQRAMVQGGVRRWNSAMADTAARFGDRVTIVDLFPISDEVLDRPDYLSPDNFHPSTAGYHRLAEVVWEMIEREGLLER